MTRTRHLLPLLAFFAVAWSATALAQTPLFPDINPQATQKPSASTADGLSPDLFYKLLLGDVALQRGESTQAARAYLDAARESQDPRIARRATEIALASRQRPLAQEAAKLWAALDPAADRPKQVIAALAAGGNDRDAIDGAGDDELKSRLARLLSDAAVSGNGVGEAFLQINRLFGPQSDKKAVFRLIRDLATPYPSSAEAYFAVALAGYNTGLDDKAIESMSLIAADKAIELRPDWDRAALLKAELMGKRSPDAAIRYLQQFVATQPTSKPAAGALAQFYIEQKRYGDARAVLKALWDQDKTSRDLEFGVATISLQMKDYAEAERLFQDLKKAGYGEPGAVDLYLAQIAEETKRYDAAIVHYRAIDEGDRAWLAKLRIGALLGKQGKIDEAKRWFADLPAVTIDQRVQTRQGEAQMLREAGDIPAAYAVLKRAVDEFPESADLTYDIALIAERMNRIDEAEAHLKKLVELKPDDAQSLNALGYTLVDRTARVSEGYALIEKAHKLSPGDPFIMDSMGWALFRLGRLDEAEDFLKRALAERPDAEIAAHLGEVLWAKGDRDGARALWKVQLESNPDNAVLKETVERLAH
jgi:tetratricopeptide (TPR) repeat protein